MITIYTVAYNEEVMIEFFINHYRKRFPDCKIIVYDNESTDNTVAIANKHNCEIITYSTNNTMSDQTLLDIKNNCWKDSATNWNVICDCDELIEVTSEDIKNEEKLGTNFFKFDGYSMMNNTDEINISGMRYGFQDKGYGKDYLFDNRFIKEINYISGCHASNPVSLGPKKHSGKTYKALHYKYLSPQYTIDRHSLFKKRLSEDNIRRGMGVHYHYSREEILKIYQEKQKLLVKVL